MPERLSLLLKHIKSQPLKMIQKQDVHTQLPVSSFDSMLTDHLYLYKNIELKTKEAYTDNRPRSSEDTRLGEKQSSMFREVTG